MNINYLKNIFIIFMTILIIAGIYISIVNEEAITASERKFKNKEVIKSDNIRIGIIEFDNINPILSNNKNIQE